MGVNNRWRIGSNEDGTRMEREWNEDGLCDIECGGWIELRGRVCVVESMIECVYGIVSNPITDNE